MAVVTFCGPVGQEPEIRFTQSGQAVVSFSVAESNRYHDKSSDSWKEKPTTWWRVTAWGQLAENVSASVAKGTRVVVTGRTSTAEDYTTKDGTVRKGQIEVTADEVGVSLKFDTAHVERVERTTSVHREIVVEEEEPF